MSISTTPFRAEDYLVDAEDVAAYLAAALETGDIDFLRKSLEVIARSQGLIAVAERAGTDPRLLSEELLTDGPAVSSVLKLFSMIGVRLEATLASTDENEAA